MKNILVPVLLCFTILAHAQRHSYHFSDSIFAHEKGEYQYKATQLSFIGDYREDLITWDSIWPNMKPRHLSARDSIYFHKFHPVSAHDYIIERAKKERIIILNEAHNQPQHRVFTESLLADLYKVGYRFLGCETMPFHNDSALNVQKYPVQRTGYYSVQPQFGNMIRTALQDGYYVFGYESHGDTSINGREIQQAQHIKTFLDANPGAKIIIHCGFGHLSKTDLEGFGKTMAQRLKEYTGIEPFCVDQVLLTERSSINFDNPLFASIKLNYDAVFLDSAGNVYKGEEGSKNYDAMVYHPRTKWIKNRPAWVFANGRQPFLMNGSISATYPCLVFAFRKNEDIQNAVPVDIVELKTKADAEKTALALSKGDYYIMVQDINNEEQDFEISF